MTNTDARELAAIRARHENERLNPHIRASQDFKDKDVLLALLAGTSRVLTDEDEAFINDIVRRTTTEPHSWTDWNGAVVKFIALIRRLSTPSPQAAAPEPDEHGETPETYEEIGRAFMGEYRSALDHPACADYVCADGPSEIITHLLNKIDEAAPEPIADERVAEIARQFYEDAACIEKYGASSPVRLRWFELHKTIGVLLTYIRQRPAVKIPTTLTAEKLAYLAWCAHGGSAPSEDLYELWWAHIARNRMNKPWFAIAHAIRAALISAEAGETKPAQTLGDYNDPARAKAAFNEMARIMSEPAQDGSAE